jgi:L-lactate dehydrogenase complex protein LldF
MSDPASPPDRPDPAAPRHHGSRLSGTTLRQRSAAAVADERLRHNLAVQTDRLAGMRLRGLAAIDGVDALREAARAVKAEIIADLPAVLERMADRVLELGGHVCWADTAEDANRYIAEVASAAGARTVVKSKSMATEETGLNQALAEVGCEVVETDLGEWIIQLAGDTPSHIIGPAMHLDRHQINDILRSRAGGGDLAVDPEAMTAFARERLREIFLRADLGVTGANFGVAETGSVVLVTNEGNARMVTSMPRVHVAVMGMERAVATWDQLDLLLNLLTRSATGQPLSAYTSIVTGPCRPGEADGPDEFHLVILDNGRSEVLGTELQEILHCIRCGACLNVCPVYRQIGGHAYGWVYGGPVGAVLTPLLNRTEKEAAELGGASSLCGACMDACPVSIPLQDLLLSLRRRKAESASGLERAMWRAFAAAWSDPRRYRATLRAASLGRGLAAFAPSVPGLARWADGRETPRPAKRSFRRRWEQGDV